MSIAPARVGNRSAEPTTSRRALLASAVVRIVHDSKESTVKKTLKLRKETLSELTAEELREVVGAGPKESRGCVSNDLLSCTAPCVPPTYNCP